MDEVNRWLWPSIEKCFHRNGLSCWERFIPHPAETAAVWLSLGRITESRRCCYNAVMQKGLTRPSSVSGVALLRVRLSFALHNSYLASLRQGPQMAGLDSVKAYLPLKGIGWTKPQALGQRLASSPRVVLKVTQCRPCDAGKWALKHVLLNSH